MLINEIVLVTSTLEIMQINDTLRCIEVFSEMHFCDMNMRINFN